MLQDVELPGGSCKIFQCNACLHQTSLIAGTLFQGTKLPLSVWLLAIYMFWTHSFSPFGMPYALPEWPVCHQAEPDGPVDR